MNDYQRLLHEVREHVLTYYAEHQLDLSYHNENHTRYVVKAASVLADHYKLDDRNRFIVLAAAWFHDLGYYSCSNGHELNGAECASRFLNEQHVDEDVIDAIRRCIISTTMPQEPRDLNEEILCDADLYHLGTEEFEDKDKLMRKEAEQHHGAIPGSVWRASTIAFLKKHKYHTAYAKEVLEPVKTANLERLVSKDTKKREAKDGIAVGKVENKPDLADDQKRKKGDKPERGIETMFRISSGNHQRLSDMADNKAHILITVNSIILSAVISFLLRKLDNHFYLAIPTFILLSVSVVTMIYAILATRPNIPPGTFTKEDVDNNRVNLLFFGNFYKMSLEDYADGMWRTMGDKSFLYGSLIRDVYAQGVVLGRKYKLLRKAYNIFMFGLIISVIAFIVASSLPNSD